ncbi:RT0821/Lpp0805 family surface protein [Rhizobium sp. YIM 134829]|uniref:RT0821/Lpp0805 family surface protein n=1 Tax=Rhizobium sp. YIM 134829 TaxID=3390453 RepID=UPI0039794072
MGHIAKCRTDTKPQVRFLTIALALVGVVSLSGCMGNGLGLADASGVDLRTTGSISAPAGPGMADAAAVQSAVQSAEISGSSTSPLPWANSASGSNGVISRIEEAQSGGQLCRTFTTTRHSYEGIAKFDGTTCRTPSGAWTLTSFGPRS